MFPLFNHRLRLWYRSWAGMVLLVEVLGRHGVTCRSTRNVANNPHHLTL